MSIAPQEERLALGGRTYRIERRIHSSETSELLEAALQTEAGVRRRVAIKRLLQRDPLLAECFLREARVVSQLHHANIVSIVDFGLVDQLPVLILELVEGLDAEQLRREAGSIPEAVVLHVGAEVAHALHYAHQARGSDGRPLSIVHRDVKPTNLLISWVGDVKLFDFGVAKIGPGERTSVGITRGTPEFMSPEQARAGAVDGRADIFSLGCTICALLTGESPLAAEEVRRRVYTGEPMPLREDISAPLREIIRRATSFRVDRRYTTAAEMAGAMGSALAKLGQGDGRSILGNWLETLHDQTARSSSADAWGSGLWRGLIVDEDFRQPPQPTAQTSAPGLGGETETIEVLPDTRRLPALEPTPDPSWQSAAVWATGSQAARSSQSFRGDGPTRRDTMPPPQRESPWPYVLAVLGILALGAMGYFIGKVGAGAIKPPARTAAPTPPTDQ